MLVNTSVWTVHFPVYSFEHLSSACINTAVHHGIMWDGWLRSDLSTCKLWQLLNNRGCSHYFCPREINVTLTFLIKGGKKGKLYNNESQNMSLSCSFSVHSGNDAGNAHCLFRGMEIQSAVVWHVFVSIGTGHFLTSHLLKCKLIWNVSFPILSHEKV